MSNKETGFLTNTKLSKGVEIGFTPFSKNSKQMFPQEVCAVHTCVLNLLLEKSANPNWSWMKEALGKKKVVILLLKSAISPGTCVLLCGMYKDSHGNIFLRFFSGKNGTFSSAKRFL